MEKFFPDNYRKAMRDIVEIFTMLKNLGLHNENTAGLEHMKPSADALLSAAVEIWKHQNPWIQREYGEEGW